jgi:hypothetical protein
MVKRDPLSLLGDLPDFPGNTPPRNRASSPKKRVAEDYLNGARAKIYRIGGVDREFYTVGELARALNRKPVTIRSWESRGWIPKVKYRTPPPAGTQIPGKVPKGRRLYSRNQLEFLVEALSKFKLDDQRSGDWSGFRNHIRANWPAD